MAAKKIILKKRSARLLVECRIQIEKEIKFEEWLAINHSYLFDPDNMAYLRRKHSKLTARIKKAILREYPVNQLSIPC